MKSTTFASGVTAIAPHVAMDADGGDHVEEKFPTRLGPLWRRAVRLKARTLTGPPEGGPYVDLKAL
jgi:hypothetical protein